MPTIDLILVQCFVLQLELIFQFKESILRNCLSLLRLKLKNAMKLMANAKIIHKL